MTGPRTRSRELALQALFCRDVLEGTSLDVVKTVIEHAEASEEVRQFATELAEGVLGRIAELDGNISSAADNWDVSRLAVVDRNVLRLAIYEFLAMDDVPAKVTLNEAIELAKRFSTAQSGRFVNGLLDRIRKDLGLAVEGEEPPPALADVDDAITNWNAPGASPLGSPPPAPLDPDGRPD